MKLITKAGITLPNMEGNKHIYYDARKENILREVDASLVKLGTDYVDLLLVHRPDPLTGPMETAEALHTIVRQGKAVAVGVSNYTLAQFDALQSFLPIPLATNQLEFSVKTTDNFFNGASDDLLRRGIRPMAWSPLGGGSVFSGQDAQSLRLREVIGGIAAAHETSMDAIMYAWLLAHPLGILPITGTMDISRVKNAADALNIRLSRDEWYAVLAASRGVDVP
jgi:predicted oxidoreductase